MDDMAALDPYAGVGRDCIAEEAVSTWYDFQADLSKGRLHQWTLLGEGCFRAGILHIPTQVVYKVPLQPEYAYMARQEERFWGMMAAHSEYWDFVPPHQGYEVKRTDYGAGTVLGVMALPFLGDKPSGRTTAFGPSPIPSRLVAGARHVGCNDAGLGNTRLYAGRWYLIDAGGSSDEESQGGWPPKPDAQGCPECNPDYVS